MMSSREQEAINRIKGAKVDGSKGRSYPGPAILLPPHHVFGNTHGESLEAMPVAPGLCLL
jgi:hypothetical protein